MTGWWRRAGAHRSRSAGAPCAACAVRDRTIEVQRAQAKALRRAARTANEQAGRAGLLLVSLIEQAAPQVRAQPWALEEGDDARIDETGLALAAALLGVAPGARLAVPDPAVVIRHDSIPPTVERWPATVTRVGLHRSGRAVVYAEMDHAEHAEHLSAVLDRHYERVAGLPDRVVALDFPGRSAWPLCDEVQIEVISR